MKFVVSRKRLWSTIRSVLPAVGTRSTLPVLSGVRITATNAGITIEGTDFEAFAREAICHEVTVEQGEAIVTPAKALAKAMLSLKFVGDERARLRVREGSSLRSSVHRTGATSSYRFSHSRQVGMGL